MTSQMFYYLCGIRYSGEKSIFFFAVSYIFIIIIHRTVKKSIKIIKLNREELDLLILSNFENKLQKTLDRGSRILLLMPFFYIAGALCIEEIVLILTDSDFIIHAAPYFCGAFYLIFLVSFGIFYVRRVRLINKKENIQVLQIIGGDAQLNSKQK